MVHYEIINATNQAIMTNVIEVGLKTAENKAGDLSGHFLSIEFVNALESQKLNQSLRGVDAPTDCISLSTNEKAVGAQIIAQNQDGSLDFKIKRSGGNTHNWPVLGQLIVCYDIVAENAAEAGQPLQRELEWVIEHGALHLLGFHHSDHDEGKH